jgi:rhodanese-related sulfurtransferase
LLDVREPFEHALAAIPGSTLIPLGEIPDRAGELDAWRDEEIVVYCHHGVRSAHAIGWLRQLGFAKLVNLAGGIDRWSLEVDHGIPRY